MNKISYNSNKRLSSVARSALLLLAALPPHYQRYFITQMNDYLFASAAQRHRMISEWQQHLSREAPSPDREQSRFDRHRTC
ncbi:hypothetical protein GR157_16435 [Burkholderia sp. 4701]|nr:hypothetical protein [Burkholderia sp. 4701]MXN83044.1 hypothetical protein [Burkholderia sp. 4812]